MASIGRHALKGFSDLVELYGPIHGNAESSKGIA